PFCRSSVGAGSGSAGWARTETGRPADAGNSKFQNRMNRFTPVEEGFDMKISTPREVFPGESRVSMTPESAQALQKLGFGCVIETGAGLAAGFSDDAYRAAGVEIAPSAASVWAGADVIVKVRPPEPSEVA